MCVLIQSIICFIHSSHLNIFFWILFIFFKLNWMHFCALVLFKHVFLWENIIELWRKKSYKLIWSNKGQIPGNASKSVRSKEYNFSRSRLTTSEKHLSGVRIPWQMLPMLVILIPSAEFLNSISGSSGNLYSLSSILISLWSFHVSKPWPPDFYLFILYYCLIMRRVKAMKRLTISLLINAQHQTWILNT